MLESKFQVLQIRDLSNLRLFGRPGHGAPTENIRKKKFTEYQLTDSDERRRVQQSAAAESAVYVGHSSSARSAAAAAAVESANEQV